MVARGHVQNGVVVRDDGVQLPEGQEVTVCAALAAGAKLHSVLDIPPVNVGAVLRPFVSDDDLLSEFFHSILLVLLLQCANGTITNT